MIGFTTMWVSASLGGNAPLPFVLVATPFWFGSASMLSSGIAPLFNDALLAVHPGGLQLESSVCVNSHQAARECTLVRWSELALAVLGDTMCTTPPPKPASYARALEKALQVHVTSVVNGRENGVLALETGRHGRTHKWGGGLLSTGQLREVRKLVLAWAEEHALSLSLSASKEVAAQCRRPYWD